MSEGFSVNKKTVKIVFVMPNEDKKEVDAFVGESLLDTARRHSIGIYGMCDGALACSGCHVIIQEDWYHKVQKASLEEEDALDFVSDLKSNSRLACQIKIVEDFDGLTVIVPKTSCE